MKLSPTQLEALRTVDAGEAWTKNDYLTIFGMTAGTYEALERRDLVTIDWDAPLPGTRPGFERYPIRLTEAGRAALAAAA